RVAGAQSVGGAVVDPRRARPQRSARDDLATSPRHAARAAARGPRALRGVGRRRARLRHRGAAAIVARHAPILCAAHARCGVPARRRGLVLWLSLDLRMKWWLVAVAAITPRVAAAQVLSPGPLSDAHASIEGDDDCNKCHESGNKVVTRLCLACHKDLGAAI